jgi:GT2 family glycosyltransferase
MISIITSVHNQLGMNRLFYETLKKYTTLPHELIIIDNNSTDGSCEFFESRADILIKNPENYSYPYCQNQGIERASGDYLAFFNNDVLVSPHWDARLMEVLRVEKMDIVTLATNDHLESKEAQLRLNRRWKYIKYPLRTLFGNSYFSLKSMAFLTYGNWNDFCEKRFQRFGNETVEGFSGSSVMMKRSALDKVGLWDEKILDADFDLFYRTKCRAMEVKDILPVQVALGIYFHHYQRLTTNSSFAPYADAKNLIPLKVKWGNLEKELTRDIVG